MFQTKKQQYLPDIELPEATQGARALGWASIAIALTELLAPKQVEKLLGLPDSNQRRAILRILGVRELMHGVGILSSDHKPDPKLTNSVWSRVAGDVLDTALLGVAATKTKRPLSFGIVSLMVLGIGAADLLTAARLSQRTR